MTRKEWDDLVRAGGRGDVYNPDDEDSEPIRIGRIAFLRAVASVAEDALTDLQAIYRPLAPVRAPEARVRDYIVQIHGDDIASWSHRWRLDAEWVRRAAVDFLTSNALTPAEALSRKERLAPLVEATDPLEYSRVLIHEHEKGISFEINVWDWSPEEITGQEWQERVLAKVKQELEVHCESVKARLDLPPVPRRRARRGPSPDVHFQWLARFQVLEETVASIASSARVDERNVRKGLRKAADLIGLPRRSL